MVRAKCSIRKVALYYILGGLFLLKNLKFFNKNRPPEEEILVARNTKGVMRHP